MGIAFWGGFASGMSKSIEKNRERAARDKQLQADNIAETKKVVQDNQKMQYKLSQDTRTALDNVNKQILKIRGKGSGLTMSERVKENNRLMSEKADIMGSASERSIQIGDGSEQVVGELSAEPIEKLGTVTLDGKTYGIDYETATQIQESNGGLKFFGNEIKKRVPDGSGGFKYETIGDGQFLTPIENMFATDTKKRSDTSIVAANELSPAEIEYYENEGIPLDSLSSSVVDTRRKEVLKENLKKTSSKKQMLIADEFIDNRLSENGNDPIDWDSEITSKELRGAAAATDNGKTIPATLQTEIGGKLAIYSQGVDLIEYMSENNVDFDVVESFETEVGKMTGEAVGDGSKFDYIMNLVGMGDKEAAKLSKEDKRIKAQATAELLNRITADTTINSMVADYVKIISGAAVTDKERDIFYDIMTGGKFSDETARMQALTTFVSNLGNGYKKRMDTLKYDNPLAFVRAVKVWGETDGGDIIDRAREKNVKRMNKNLDDEETKSKKKTEEVEKKKVDTPAWYKFKG